METPPRLYNPQFLLLLALQLVFGLGFSSYFLLPKYLTEVHGSNADVIGLVMAASPVTAVLTIPLLALHIDRLPRRWLMVGGALGMAISGVGFAELGAPGPAMFALRALQGAGFVVYMTAATMLVTEVVPLERLGQAVGLVGAANLTTNAIAPAIAEPVARAYGWQPVFLASALCSALALVAALFVPQRRRIVRQSLPGETPPAPIWQPRFLRLVYAGTMIGVAFGTVITFYQPLALELGIRNVRDLFVGFTLSALLVRVLLGNLLDRVDKRRTVVLACAAYALVVLATAGLQPGWLFPLGLGIGFAHGAFWPVLTALCVDGSDPRVRGKIMTWFGGSFHLGVTVSTLGFGFLAHAVGYRPVMVLAAAFAASASWVLAGYEAAKAPALEVAPLSTR
jgi:MFS family permease